MSVAALSFCFALGIWFVANPTNASSRRICRQTPHLVVAWKCQSGAILSNKIAGARRKLARAYELDFLDGPIVLDDSPFGNSDARAWWLRKDDGTNEHILVPEAIEYVQRATAGKEYGAIVGFSQGGTLATALAVSGILRVQAIVTAGAPNVKDVFDQTFTIVNRKYVCIVVTEFFDVSPNGITQLFFA